jgi:predicted Rossmann fold flavoprotein
LSSWEPQIPQKYDAIVLGGGAAGLFCAAIAGQRGRKVVVVERNQEPGRKILISGGGRCNFTNLHCRPEHFLSSNPAFARSALARYEPSDFIALVERYGIAYHEKTMGQLFCDGSSRQIVDLLLEECRLAGVEVITGCEVANVRDGFAIETSRGMFEAPALVVATGGLSVPKIGATDLGYRIARQFGVALIPPRPALVPLLFDDSNRARWTDLAGIATPSVVSVLGTKAVPLGTVPNGTKVVPKSPAFEERLLFTHRGLSGPAILQASSYWQPDDCLSIDLLPHVNLAAEIVQRRSAGDVATTKTAVAAHVPNRLADRWFETEAHPSTIATTGNDTIRALEAGLHTWTIKPVGTEGFAKAEVTAGGVDTRELSSTTMEVRERRGLYFIGEVVDVTGHLGGFNFQWAWASGHAAGLAI